MGPGYEVGISVPATQEPVGDLGLFWCKFEYLQRIKMLEFNIFKNMTLDQKKTLFVTSQFFNL